MNCPNCDVELLDKSYTYYHVQYCDKCYYASFVYSENSCDHELVQIKFEKSNGTYLIRDYCKKCHRLVGKNKKLMDFKNINLPIKNLEKYHNFLEELRSKSHHDATIFLTECHNKETEIKNKSEFLRKQQFDSWYEEYRQTDKWKLKRHFVLERDKYLCQLCLNAPANLVHHLTYTRVGNELTSDLISVCKKCHAFLHEIKDEEEPF